MNNIVEKEIFIHVKAAKSESITYDDFTTPICLMNTSKRLLYQGQGYDSVRNGFTFLYHFKLRFLSLLGTLCVRQPATNMKVK